jgi:hypothetical protein
MFAEAIEALISRGQYVVHVGISKALVDTVHVIVVVVLLPHV